MSEIVEQVRMMTEVAWKALCALGILSLGLLILDRRAAKRQVRQVQRAEATKDRRAA